MKATTHDETFRLMFENYYDRVYRAAYYITKDRFLAQDAAQDTFIKAYCHLGNIQDLSKIGAWLAVIAANTAIDHMRKRKLWNGLPTEDKVLLSFIENSETASTVEHAAVLSEEISELRIQLEQLHPEYRQVLILKYNAGLKDEETARLLGVTAGTIKSRAYRAKRKLKKMLIEASHGIKPSCGDEE